jgi:hypothetical protein
MQLSDWCRFKILSEIIADDFRIITRTFTNFQVFKKRLGYNSLNLKVFDDASPAFENRYLH